MPLSTVPRTSPWRVVATGPGLAAALNTVHAAIAVPIEIIVRSPFDRVSVIIATTHDESPGKQRGMSGMERIGHHNHPDPAPTHNGDYR
jgi:hypothetical protein